MTEAAEVPLFRRSLRPLGSEPTGVKEPADMVRVGGGPKAVADELGNPLAGPERRAKPEGFGSAKNPADQGSALRDRQFGRPARGRAGLHPVSAPLAVRLLPATDRGAPPPHAAGGPAARDQWRETGDVPVRQDSPVDAWATSSTGEDRTLFMQKSIVT